MIGQQGNVGEEVVIFCDKFQVLEVEYLFM